MWAQTFLVESGKVVRASVVFPDCRGPVMVTTGYWVNRDIHFYYSILWIMTLLQRLANLKSKFESVRRRVMENSLPTLHEKGLSSPE